MTEPACSSSAVNLKDVSTIATTTTCMFTSPIPSLSEQPDEEDSDAVRALASRLAPVLDEANELLRLTQEFQSSSSKNLDMNEDVEEEEDDDMDNEMEALGISEAMLRQELELAKDFSDLFTVQYPSIDSEEESTNQTYNKQKELPSVTTPERSSCHHSTDDTSKHTERKMSTPQNQKSQPIWKFETPPRSLADDSLFIQKRNEAHIHYTAKDHIKVLQVKKEERGGFYSVCLARHLDGARTLDSIHHDVKEYCTTMPESKLRQLYIDVPDSSRRVPFSKSRSSPHKASIPESLPVRTITMRIRPDVLSGAVMDGVHHALKELSSALIIKRQGGHCQAIVREVHYLQHDEYGQQLIRYRPYFVDILLTTYKSDACERMLLIRIYHSSIVEAEENDTGESPTKEDLITGMEEVIEQPIQDLAALHLRECAALIQLMEAPARAHNSILTPSDLTQENIESVVSTHLLSNFHECPSVKRGGITSPALNTEDFEVIVSSWRLTRAVWEELETRDLTYTTLTTARFGAFPSLPTLDVHYCAQIRRLSRERMVFALIKAASDLEKFAREAELACASMIKLLEPTFDTFGVDAPSIPRAKSLTDYPLDFVPSQDTFPPFGEKVQHALNEIQALSSDACAAEPFASHTPSTQSIDPERSLIMAADAVKWVLEAFRSQDDEEQSARLIRKNVHVMDRLANMQAHQKLSIQIIDNCASQSAVAARAADSFERKAGIREVPLLKWSIVVGRATGTCTVTAHHILFLTQLIPVIGGYTTTLINIDDLEFTLKDTSLSLLNPLPAVITISKHGDEIYSFRPSFGGPRLKSFLQIVTAAAALQEPLTLPDNPKSLISIPDDASLDEAIDNEWRNSVVGHLCE